MKNLLIAIILLIAPMFSIGSEMAKNLEDVHSASCRVVCSNPGGRSGSTGTGTVIALTDNRYWVLTNWHVVNGFNTFRLEFFRDGKIFAVNGKLEGSWHNERAPWDFAILTVDEKQLAPYDPPIVPLADKTAKPLLDSPILSSGCTEGRWSMAWKGSVESFYGDTAQFFPAPKSGQSGSAIVREIDGQLRVTGILTWRVGDSKSEEQMRGGAIPISKFYDALLGNKTVADTVNSIPPHSVWISEPETRTYPVFINDDEVEFANTSYDTSDIIVHIFISDTCIPCQTIKPLYTEMANKVTVEIHDVATDSGKVWAKMCKVTSIPTTLIAKKSDNLIYDVVVGSGAWKERVDRSILILSGRTTKNDLALPSYSEILDVQIGYVAPLVDYLGGKKNPSPSPLTPSSPPPSYPSPSAGLLGNALIGGNAINDLVKGISTSTDKHMTILTNKTVDSMAKADEQLVSLKEMIAASIEKYVNLVIIYTFGGAIFILIISKLFDKITSVLAETIKRVWKVES